MPTDHSPSTIIPHAFPGISPAETAELINNSRLTEYPAEAVLSRENATEHTCYLILEGEVEVTKTINNDQTRLLKVLTAGDFFGEMALIHNAPRAATVKSVTALSVLEINREAFDRVLKNSSSISLAMVREISRRLRENDKMAIDDLRLRASELAVAYQILAEQELARRNFLTNITHQLRTPLMAAGGYLQILQKGVIPPVEVPAVMETVSRNVQKITTLVNDILFVQEMDLILDKFEPVNLVQLIRRIVKDVEPRAKQRRIAIVLKPGLFLPSVVGDVHTLDRAFTALIDNAVKFSLDKGRVEIRLRRKQEQVSVVIADRGIGIAAEDLPHIFDRFYHLENNKDDVSEGLWLGLAITRQVIAQHQGSLEVVSTPGKGSTFTVRLNTWKE